MFTDHTVSQSASAGLFQTTPLNTDEAVVMLGSYFATGSRHPEEVEVFPAEVPTFVKSCLTTRCLWCNLIIVMFSVLELEVTKIHILTYLFSKLQITGESTYYFKIIFAAFTSFI